MYKIVFIITFFTMYVNGNDYDYPDTIDMTLKLLGGQPVLWTNWSFMAYLSIEVTAGHFYGIKQCSATILNAKWLLSAAHCFDHDLPKGIKTTNVKIVMTIYVVPGERTVKQGQKSEIRAKPYCHEEYSHGSVGNDICVLKLSKNLTFSDNITAVKLPGNEQVTNDEICTTAGWGGSIQHMMTVNQSVDLKEAYQKLEHNEICEEIFNKIFRTNYSKEIHICSALVNPFSEGDKYGPYKGDSGGPLICKGKQFGIISFGPSKEFITVLPRDFLGVTYTKVVHYLDWINRTIDEQVKIEMRSSQTTKSENLLTLMLLFIYHIIPS